MSKRRYAMMFALLASTLTNAFGLWEVFAHELDEHRPLPDPAAHLEAHQAVATDEGHLDAATHLCLHAAGQYQPFFFTAPPLVPASDGTEVPSVFISNPFPESVPDSPLHPPRNTFAS
jgi:hypothetical protein